MTERRENRAFTTAIECDAKLFERETNNEAFCSIFLNPCFLCRAGIHRSAGGCGKVVSARKDLGLPR